MLKIGVTGGIGSGKSWVCKIFGLLGVPVFDADRTAKTLINENITVRNSLIYLFGDGIYGQNNILNRKMLAELIFHNDTLLEKVNAIIHPEVRSAFLEWGQKQVGPYMIHEAAILFETGFSSMMDFNILVEAPEPLRIRRVMDRDCIPAEKVLERINRQWPDEKKRELADCTILNDDRHLIIPQIIEIDLKLRSNGKIW